MSLALTFGLLALSLVGLIGVPLDFLPLPNEGVLLMSFTLPPGTSLLDSEAAVRVMTHKLLADPAVAHVYARIGSSASTMYTEPGYAGEMQIALKPGIAVNSLDRIGMRVQRESKMPGVPWSLDTPTIERVGESLSGLPQPFAIDGFGIDVAAYGLTSAALYAQVEPLLNGKILAQVPDGNVPLDVYLRLAYASHLSLAGPAALPIRTGGWTPLGQLASIQLATTPNQIRHIGGALALEISATPTGPLGSTVSAAKAALAGLQLAPGYRIQFGGLYPELRPATWDRAPRPGTPQ